MLSSWLVAASYMLYFKYDKAHLFFFFLSWISNEQRMCEPTQMRPHRFVYSFSSTLCVSLSLSDSHLSSYFELICCFSVTGRTYVILPTDNSVERYLRTSNFSWDILFIVKWPYPFSYRSIVHMVAIFALPNAIVDIVSLLYRLLYFFPRFSLSVCMVCVCVCPSCLSLNFFFEN